MTLHPRAVIWLLTLVVLSDTAAHAQPASKFRPAANAIGWDRYVVTLQLRPGDDPAAIAGQLAATYRGRLEPFAREGFNGFAISMSAASARLLSQNDRVAFVEGVETPAPSAAAATPPAPPPPPAPVAHIAQTTASGAMATLQPRTTDSGSQWSTGVYSYDGSGNITNIGPDDYVYDRLGRVTSGTAGSGKQQSYTYDRYGNITTITTAATPAPIVRQLGVNAATNQASNSAPQYDPHGTYDAAGNVRTWSTGESFDYDGLGMVREATLEGAKKLYIYSASDERIATISMTNGIETDSMWTIRDTSGKVLRRLQKTGAGSAATWTWKQDYIYRGNQLLAAETDGPEHTLHFHPDHLGTPRLITGNGGAKVSLHHYYPFGEEATDPLQDTERLKFTGHERDTARLDYMHARYYSPNWGRFLSVDPTWASADLGKPQTWNRYSYVLNNPINYTDPDGRCTDVLTCGTLGFSLGNLPGAVIGTVGAGLVIYGGSKVNWQGVGQWFAGGGGSSGEMAAERFAQNMSNHMAEKLNASQANSRSSASNSNSSASPQDPKNDKSREKAIKSLEQRVDEHKQKLEAYKANPDAFDNKGILKSAPNAEVRQRIINGRIKHLEHEIQTFQKQVEALRN